MAKKYVMALDAGTTSNRAIIFDENSKIVGVAQKEFTQHFPKPGWVEHDADEIWSTMCEVMKGALEKSGLEASDIAAIGITNQRETAVVWDKNTGRPVYNAIVWQSRQTADIANDLKAKGLTEEFKQKTGLTIDAYFSGTKITWILKNSQVSPEVMAAFDERHAVLRSCKKTVVDHVAGHIALTFELVYPISLQIAKERGYLDKMMAFESDNEITGKQFEEIRAKLNEYVESVRTL